MTTTTSNKPKTAFETMPPQAIVMQMVMGAWLSQTISAVTRLNVPDALKRHSPQSALELTQKSGINADPEFLQRALRACASVGIVTEDTDGKFGATALSDVLTSDSAVSVKKITEIFGNTWWQVWEGLYDAIQTGQSQAKSRLGMEYWDYCKANPQEMEDFGEAMKSNSLNSLQGVLENCDFSDVSQIADIGGGFGHLAIELVKKHKHLTGIVLDIPELIPVAQKHMDTQDSDVISKITFVGGDMFEAVPPAQVYIMKHIIHDWDNERCIQLLKNCYANMEGDGRIICVDSVLSPMGNTDSTPAKLLDLNMMVFIPGKERTEEQWRDLYHAAGFKITSITPIHDNFGTSIVEGVKI